MNDAIMIFVSIIISFLLGAVVWLWVLRGFLIPYLASKKNNKLLLRVFLKSGGTVFCVGTVGEGGLIHYKLFGHPAVATVVEDAVVRSVRSRWLDLAEGDTAPFIHKKVLLDTRVEEYEDMQPVLDDHNKPLFDEHTGQPLYEKVLKKREVPVMRLFTGWDDTGLIKNALLLVSQKPKIPIGSGLGFNLKTFLIIVVVIAAGVFITMLLQGGIGGSPTTPTIP